MIYLLVAMPDSDHYDTNLFVLTLDAAVVRTLTEQIDLANVLHKEHPNIESFKSSLPKEGVVVDIYNVHEFDQAIAGAPGYYDTMQQVDEIAVEEADPEEWDTWLADMHVHRIVNRELEVGGRYEYTPEGFYFIDLGTGRSPLIRMEDLPSLDEVDE